MFNERIGVDGWICKLEPEKFPGFVIVGDPEYEILCESLGWLINDDEEEEFDAEWGEM